MCFTSVASLFIQGTKCLWLHQQSHDRSVTLMTAGKVCFSAVFCCHLGTAWNILACMQMLIKVKSFHIGIWSLQRYIGNPHFNTIPERILCPHIWRIDAAAFANMLLTLPLLCGHCRWSYFLPFTVTGCCTIKTEHCGKVNYSLRAFVIFPPVPHLIFTKFISNASEAKILCSCMVQSEAQQHFVCYIRSNIRFSFEHMCTFRYHYSGIQYFVIVSYKVQS